MVWLEMKGAKMQAEFLLSEWSLHILLVCVNWKSIMSKISYLYMVC